MKATKVKMKTRVVKIKEKTDCMFCHKEIHNEGVYVSRWGTSHFICYVKYLKLIVSMLEFGEQGKAFKALEEEARKKYSKQIMLEKIEGVEE